MVAIVFFAVSSLMYSMDLQERELLPEIQKNIWDKGVVSGNCFDSLQQASQTISSVARVNKGANAYFNHPAISCALIQNLSKRYKFANGKCPVYGTVFALRTKDAKQRQLQYTCYTNWGILDVQAKLEKLCDAGVNLNFQYEQQYYPGYKFGYHSALPYAEKSTPLALVCQMRERVETDKALPLIIDFLLSKKVDATIVDQDGRTALMQFIEEKRASFEDLQRFITAVQNNKVNVGINKQDSKGNTALMYLCKYYAPWTRFRRIFEPMVEFGADITIKNHEGKTAIDMIYGTDERKAEVLAWYHEKQKGNSK